MMADLRDFEGQKTRADEMEAENFISTNSFNDDASNRSENHE
jgi:hypothetical protein